MTATSRKWSLAALLAFVSSPAFALDAPHDATNLPQVCATCHTTHASLGSVLTNTAGINNLCQSCHYDGGPVSSRAVVHTHKSNTAGGGDFDFEHQCTDCHDPHSQEQPTFPGGTGGQFLTDEVRTPTGALVPITITARSGAGSFADGDAIIDGICEVCHTQTTHYTSSTAESGRASPHNLATDCTTCHSHRDTDDVAGLGFRPVGGSCIECHNAVKGDRRLVTTEFSAAGSHHISRSFATNPLNDYDCIVCHLEGDETGSTTDYHNDASYTVNLRNVDDSSDVSLTWQDPDTIDVLPNGAPASCSAPDERTELTMFCVSCHDADGVGDATFIAALDAADTAVIRTAGDPFGEGAVLIDVSGQFDPANYSSHSLSCWFDSSSASCSGECAAGTHNAQSTGSCTADEDCSPSPCPGSSTCSVTSGEETCTCPLNWDGASCNTCAPGYSGASCTIDACVTSGASCADGHGTCSIGAASEQFTYSNATGWTAGTWTSVAAATANGGTAHRAASSTSQFSRSVTTQAGTSASYKVWAACSSTNTNQTVTMTVSIDGTALGTVTCAKNSGYGWLSVGTKTGLSAAAHTFAVTCPGYTATKACNFDGLVITTDTALNPVSNASFTPYTSANWDASALDYYTAAGGSCSCAAGYTGSDCTTCASGYHQEDGACVSDSAGACAGVTCDGYGTCYIATDPTGNVTDTYGVCDCTEHYYGSTLTTCDQCDTRVSGTWTSGQNPPTAPGPACGSWDGWDCATGSSTALSNSGWDELSTTECADCHLPGKTTGSQPYSNNAHGSVNTEWMMDDASGLDAAPVDSVSGTTMTVVCVKCHNAETYAYNGSVTGYSRYTQHVKSAHMDGVDNVFGNGCMNCHGGGAWGSIHGQSTVVTDDDGKGSYNAIFFMDGASIDYWSAAGSSVTCSARGSLSTYNLGCTQHGSQSYTRAY